jgi:hypothetical protein
MNSGKPRADTHQASSAHDETLADHMIGNHRSD